MNIIKITQTYYIEQLITVNCTFFLIHYSKNSNKFKYPNRLR